MVNPKQKVNMKITDLNVIADAVRDVINEIGCDLSDYLEPDDVINCITMIYVTGDRQTGCGQDFTVGISVVSSPTRVAIIGDGAMSFYKTTDPICQYEDLDDDITQIITVVNAATARWMNNL